MPDLQPRQGDSDVILLRKLVSSLGGQWDVFDGEKRLWQKLVTLSGGQASPFDSRHTLIRKLLVASGGEADRWTSESQMLRQWVSLNGGNAALGDTFNTLLRASLAAIPQPTWNPSYLIHDVVAWYSSDALVSTSGGVVTSWGDRSGNGNTLTPASDPKRPALTPDVLNGLPGVTFDGVDDALQSPNFGLTQPFTIYYLARQNGYAMGRRVFTGLNINDVYIYKSNSVAPNVTLRSGSNIGPTFSTWTVGNFDIHQTRWDGANTKIHRQLTTVQGGNPGTGGLDGIVLGGNTTGAANGNVEFIELIIRQGIDDAYTGFLHYMYLATRAGFDVRNFYAEGDSMTAGVGLSPSNLWPHSVLTAKAPTLWGYNNGAVGGSTIPQMAARAATADKFSDTRAVENYITVWCGTNDIASQDATANEVVAGLTSYCASRRLAGYKVLVLTILPRTVISGQKEVERQAANDLIRSTWHTFADGLVDVANDPTLGAENANLNPTYYSDGTHLTAAGNSIVAGLVAAQLP